MKVFVLGDSHSRSYSFNDNFVPLFIGQGKKYNFVSDDNLNNIIQGLKSTLPLCESENIMLTFGEPDTRFYLGKGWTPWSENGEDDLSSYEKLIDESVRRYSRLISFLKLWFDKNFFICNITPSERRNQNILVYYFNAELRKLCADEKVQFVDLQFELIKESVVQSLMGDIVHMSNKIQPLIEEWFVGEGVLKKSKYKLSDWNNKNVHAKFKFDEKFGCYKLIEESSKGLDLSKINKELSEKGVYVAESLVSHEVLEKLNQEFDEFMVSEQKGARFTEYSEGVCVRLTANEFDKVKFSATEEFFYANDLRIISENFLETEPNLNEEIFIVKDVVGSKHIANDLHYDVTPTLKFFIYLSDTTEENGAFRCVPGSHKRTETYRNDKNISFDSRHLTRELDIQDFPMEIPIEGKAGTLIVFHTDVWHKAGIVSKGDRKVMRGHTRPKVDLTNQKEPNKGSLKKPSIFRRVINRLK